MTTVEGGAPSGFIVRLNRAPSASVTIAIGPVDASEWQVLDTAIVLDASNWQAGHSVVVTPVDDDLIDGEQSTVLTLGTAQSTDPQFAGIEVADVTLVNGDSDEARIEVTPTTGLIVDENGATANFLVALSVAPNADVMIPLSSGDATEFALADSVMSSRRRTGPRERSSLPASTTTTSMATSSVPSRWLQPSAPMRATQASIRPTSA